MIRSLNFWCFQVVLPAFAAIVPAIGLWVFEDVPGAEDLVASGALAFVGVFLLFAAATEGSDSRNTLTPFARTLYRLVELMGVFSILLCGCSVTWYALGSQLKLHEGIHCLIATIGDDIFRALPVPLSDVKTHIVACIPFGYANPDSSFVRTFSEEPEKYAALFSIVSFGIFATSILVTICARIGVARASRLSPGGSSRVTQEPVGRPRRSK